MSLVYWEDIFKRGYVCFVLTFKYEHGVGNG